MAPSDDRYKVLTLNFLSFESRAKNRASALLFTAFIAGHLVILWAFVRYAFRSTWDQHLESGIGAILITVLVCHLMMCFGEHFFHRYLLHVETTRGLRGMTQSHLAHHKLTGIRFDDAEQKVRSEYAINGVHRDEDSTFPPLALTLFFGFFTPFFIPIAFSFPRVPILIGGYGALALSHFLYEMLHVAHHQPHEWWQRRIDGRLLGPLWRKMYGFHQAHHANYKCNLNIAGFFGIPLADLAFGTYKQPDDLLVDGAAATKAVARRLTPEPRWPISWLDRVVIKRRRWLSKEDRSAAPGSRRSR